VPYVFTPLTANTQVGTTLSLINDAITNTLAIANSAASAVSGPIDDSRLSVNVPLLVASNLTLPGNLVVTGTLEVVGTTTKLDSTVIDLNARMFHPNFSAGNTGVPALITGMGIYRGAVAGTPRENASFVWDEAGQQFVAAFTAADDSALGTGGFVALKAGKLTITGTPAASTDAATVSYVTAGDAATLVSARSYTDASIATASSAAVPDTRLSANVGLLNVAQTYTAKKTFQASTATTASLTILPGTAPTTPANGDVWTTTTGILTQLGGATRSFLLDNSNLAAANLTGTVPKAVVEGPVLASYTLGNKASTTAVFIWGYYGGTIQLTNGTSTLVPDGTVALSSNAINYIQLDPSTGNVFNNTSGFTAGFRRMARITTGGAGITASEDSRDFTGGAASTGLSADALVASFLGW
jgi:hypothetical protein